MDEMYADDDESGPAGDRAAWTIDRVAQAVAGLSEAKFLAAVDVLTSGGDQPLIGGLLSRVRHRLRDLRPTRTPSLKRLFCRPFEDLLVSSYRTEAPSERVSRAALVPVWQVLVRRNRTRFESLDTELRMLAASEPQRIYAVAERLWRIAGATLAAETPLEPESMSAAVLIRQTLAAALEIEAYKRVQPANPLPTLTPSAERSIRAGIDMLTDRGLPPDAFLRVVAARMAKPAELAPIIAALGTAA